MAARINLVKSGFFAFLLAFSSAISSQNNVELKINEQENIHGFSFWNKLAVKSKDTTFVISLHPVPSNFISLKKTGVYDFTFYSIFGDVITKKVKVSKNKVAYNVSDLTKIFRKSSSKKSISSCLAAADTLVILHSETQPSSKKQVMPSYRKIALTKTKAAEFIAFQYDNTGNDITQTMKLSEKQYLDIVGVFEKKAKSLTKKSDCNKKEYYTMKLQGQYFSFVDESCEWNGFTGLIAGLFASEK